MEKVRDAIQKNLPAQISSMHWKVGPLQARGSDDSDDDILAQSNAKTFASRQTDYDLMTTDEQVAVATAAAAAAHALELEQQRQRSSPQQGYFLSGMGIKRNQNQSNHQQRYRQHHQPPQVVLQEVFQGLRERTPQYIQEIRERTPQYMQEIRERTPRYMQEIREKTPQYMQDIRERTPQYVRTAIKNVRDQVWQVDDNDGPMYDCDASGRRIQQVSGDGQYSGSLNEIEDHYVSSQEMRDQPPPYNSNFIPARYEEVWNQFCQNNPRIASKAAAAMNRVAPTTATAAATSAGSSAEYYVNFSDGDTQKAISAVTTNMKRDSTNASTKSTTTEISMSGYADMDGEYAHPTPLHQPQQPQHDGNSMAGNPSVSTSQEQKQQQDRSHASVASPSRKNHVQPSMHSSAHYQWGAKQHAPDTSDDSAHPAATISTSQETVQPSVVDTDENGLPIEAHQSLEEESPPTMKENPEEHSDTDVSTDSDNEDDKDHKNGMDEDEDQANDTSQSCVENQSTSPPSEDATSAITDATKPPSMHSTAKVNWSAAIYKSSPVFRTQNGVM